MNYQRYYTNQEIEIFSDICDTTKDLCINCAGVEDDSTSFENVNTRKDYYMLYLVDGKMYIEFDNFKGNIFAGDLLIIKPGTRYTHYNAKGSGLNYLWVHFTGRNAEKLIKDAHIPINCICSVKQSRDVIEYWKKMFNEFIIHDEHFNNMTSSILIEMLTCFSRQINNAAKTRLFKSIVYIHENYNNKLSIKDLASMENLSESYYRSIFLRTFGESPVEYITSLRITAAVNLLETTNKKLAEIAELVGYSDVYYFGKQFKKKLGQSPGSYRRNN